MRFPRILCLIGSMLLCLNLPAQDVDRYGGVYHPYRHGELKDTPAPRGYKAFYISHIGRHGSRYPVDLNYIMHGLGPLTKADSLGLLTDEGKKLLHGFQKLDSISREDYGMLCELGAAEHNGIGERMARRFPTVFKGSKDSIVIVCTYKTRTIMSAANFLSGFKGYAPKMKVGFFAGEKYYNYICREDQAKSGLKVAGKLSDKMSADSIDFKAFYSRILTDPARSREIVRHDRVMLETCYTNGTVAAYLGIPDIVECLTPEEYRLASLSYNNKMYVSHCNSLEQGDWRVHLMDTLLVDWITRADAAIAGNKIAADLRFSHDVGMMPFYGLIGVAGNEQRADFLHAYDVWNSTEIMPMGANLQMIFYRNRKGDVLVKVLLNEEETEFPLLVRERDVKAPYYKWNNLRDYLLGRLSSR